MKFKFFYPTALATAYGQRPKFVMAEHSATAEGENCAYGPTLNKSCTCEIVHSKEPAVFFKRKKAVMQNLNLYLNHNLNQTKFKNLLIHI